MRRLSAPLPALRLTPGLTRGLTLGLTPGLTPGLTLPAALRLASRLLADLRLTLPPALRRARLVALLLAVPLARPLQAQAAGSSFSAPGMGNKGDGPAACIQGPDCADYDDPYHHGCGSRGGPGCRKDNGHCAAWRDGFARDCRIAPPK